MGNEFISLFQVLMDSFLEINFRQTSRLEFVIHYQNVLVRDDFKNVLSYNL